jgi:lipoate---protein ligase
MILWNDTQNNDIAWNIAADEAMLTGCEQGWLGETSILRIWQQRSWAVVLGASGKIRHEVYHERCQQLGIPIARRSSGGGTVLLGPGTFCLSWVRPISDFPTDQRGVRELQVQMLTELATPLSRPDRNIEVIAAGDWAINGMKCAGSAQRRQKSHVLVHASVLNQTDLQMITSLLPEPERRPEYRMNRSHSGFLTNLGLDMTRLHHQVRSLLPDCIEIDQPSKNLIQLTNELADERFRLLEWTDRF